jgi:hypothetical protein
MSVPIAELKQETTQKPPVTLKTPRLADGDITLRISSYGYLVDGIPTVESLDGIRGPIEPQDVTLVYKAFTVEQTPQASLTDGIENSSPSEIH